MQCTNKLDDVYFPQNVESCAYSPKKESPQEHPLSSPATSKLLHPFAADFNFVYPNFNNYNLQKNCLEGSETQLQSHQNNKNVATRKELQYKHSKTKAVRHIDRARQSDIWRGCVTQNVVHACVKRCTFINRTFHTLPWLRFAMSYNMCQSVFSMCSERVCKVRAHHEQVVFAHAPNAMHLFTQSSSVSQALIVESRIYGTFWAAASSPSRAMSIFASNKDMFLRRGKSVYGNMVRFVFEAEKSNRTFPVLGNCFAVVV